MSRSVYKTTVPRQGYDVPVAVTIECNPPPPYERDTATERVVVACKPLFPAITLTEKEEEDIISEWLIGLSPEPTAAEAKWDAEADEADTDWHSGKRKGDSDDERF